MTRYIALLQRNSGNTFDQDVSYNRVTRDHRAVMVPEGQSLDMEPGSGPARPWLNSYLDGGWHLAGFVEVATGEKHMPALGIEVELRRRWKQYRDNSVSNDFSNMEQMAFGGRAGGVLEALDLIEAIPLSDASSSTPN